MNQILRPGQSVSVGASGLTCRVEQLLGGGGQGEVYRASIGSQSLALKWYFPLSATPEQLDALTTLVRKGPPSERFLWPLDITWSNEAPGFGYIMPLRDARYSGMVDLMQGSVSPKFRTLTTVGFQLASSFLQLHAAGLCYRDISFGNAFFDADSGEVLICDNDNVAVNGQARGGVLGTPRFMAPEIVRGEAVPSACTDLFSLAVLLFYIFMVAHPLEGAREASIKCFDNSAMVQLYGEEPIFIFDPADDSNRPMPDYQGNALAYWPIYPKFLQELFTQTFTAGLRDPEYGRVHDSVWKRAMVRLRDAILYCGRCTAENFFCADTLAATGGLRPCWSCGQTVSLPPRIRIGRELVMLNHDTVLYPHHTDDARLWDFSAPVAKVVQHPVKPDVWGLENMTDGKWTCTLPSGNVTDVPPGKRAPLAAGTRLVFGSRSGEITL